MLLFFSLNALVLPFNAYKSCAEVSHKLYSIQDLISPMRDMPVILIA